MSVGTAPLLLTRREAGVLHLTLNRPEVLNGLNDDLLDAITAGCEEATGDDGVHVVVITGGGRAFCSGQDLTAGLGDSVESVDVGTHLREHYTPMVRAIRGLEKPVIAAVNGVAAGAGLSLALACDLRIAAESATFIQAFVRIGLVPDAGGSYFLPRLVGAAKALEMSLLGDVVDAAEALRIGLVTAVIPDEGYAAGVQAFAARLARGPRSVGMIKALLSASLDNDLETQLTLEEEMQRRASATDDFREGVTAFIEKRPSEFGWR